MRSSWDTPPWMQMTHTHTHKHTTHVHTNLDALVLGHAAVDADGGEVAVHQQLVQRVGTIHLQNVECGEERVSGCY